MACVIEAARFGNMDESAGKAAKFQQSRRNAGGQAGYDSISLGMPAAGQRLCDAPGANRRLTIGKDHAILPMWFAQERSIAITKCPGIETIDHILPGVTPERNVRTQQYGSIGRRRDDETGLGRNSWMRHFLSRAYQI